MSNDDFNFAPPPPRRESKGFEPPPWERDQFEELQKRRVEPEPGLDETARAADPPVVVIAEPPATQPQSEPPKQTEQPHVAQTHVDEGRVTAMLFELRAEDPSVSQSVNKVGLIAGLALLVLGILLVIWAMAMIMIASRQSEPGMGVMVGFTVMMFGAGFAGAGSWFAFKSLRQQGVL